MFFSIGTASSIAALASVLESTTAFPLKRTHSPFFDVVEISTLGFATNCLKTDFVLFVAKYSLSSKFITAPKGRTLA